MLPLRLRGFNLGLFCFFNTSCTSASFGYFWCCASLVLAPTGVFVTCSSTWFFLGQALQLVFFLLQLSSKNFYFLRICFSLIRGLFLLVLQGRIDHLFRGLETTFCHVVVRSFFLRAHLFSLRGRPFLRRIGIVLLGFPILVLCQCFYFLSADI